MRKRHIILSIFCCLLFPCMVSASTNVNSANPSFEYLNIPDEDTIRELCEQTETIDSVLMALEAEGIIISADPTIEWSAITKRYVDTDITSLNTSDEEVIIQTLNEGSYCYDVSVFVDGNEVECTFSVGNPPREGIKRVLTKEQYQDILDKVGKWSMTSFGVVNSSMSYRQVMEKFNLDQYDNAVIASSQEGFNYPIVIGFKDGQAVDIYPVYGAISCPILYDTGAQPNENGAYSFLQIPKWQEEYDAYLAEQGVNPAKDLYKRWIAIGILISAVAVIMIVYLVTNNRKN